MVFGVSQERDDFIKLVEGARPAMHHQQRLWGAAGGQLGGLHMDEVDVQPWGDRTLSEWGMRGQRPVAGETAVAGLRVSSEALPPPELRHWVLPPQPPLPWCQPQ